MPSFSTPLGRVIIEAPCPEKVKIPTIDPFDRTTDPDDHLDAYKAHMYVLDVDNITFCIYFLATLKGIVQKWFNGLPNGNITTFLQLAGLFSTHFITSKRERKDNNNVAKM